ncbi:MAG TPA: MBL fold metallo-hydrolase [Beijerinckiaceae bacterium]|jgi:ribonuclease BN (tRNA processing enzyme)
MRLTVVGCGDAFGSGGRANTCFLVETAATTVALDFGATSLVALKRLGIDPNRIDAVVLSHLHGDHFGGLPFLFLDAQFDSHRDKPLTVIGPPGTAERVRAAQEVFFPGSSGNKWKFRLDIVDLPLKTDHAFADLGIWTLQVVHPSGAPSTAVRLTAGGRTLVFSGDTSWTEALVEIAQGADLFITECYRLAGAPVAHLSLEEIEANRARFNARRIMLTHMSQEVLKDLAAVEVRGYVAAHDGLVLDL